QIAQRWTEFLDLFVAKRIPEIPPVARALVPGTIEGVFGGPLEFDDDRLADAASYEEALEQFREDPRYTLLMEAGYGLPDNPGVAEPTFEIESDEWPVPGVEATTLYLQPEGLLGPDEPTAADDDDGAMVTYAQDPGQADQVTLPGDAVGDAFAALPPYEWNQPEEGSLASWTTEPLEEDTTLVGPSRADLWLASTAEDTDVEVTITEVREDGTEFLVQSGWQRASARALDEERSDELHAVPTFQAGDNAQLTPGELVEVSVQIFPATHVFRAGSSIRITVDSPGGNRPRWEFDTLEQDGETNTIALSADHPSRLTLGILPGVDAPADLPVCPSLRAQPCRTLEPVENELADEGDPSQTEDPADAA
ncbi:MAG: CocE/NonD family hydrolase, partial [Actinomycetota bacterium]